MKSFTLNRAIIVQKTTDSISLFDPEKSNLYTLNSTAGFIFKKIQQRASAEEIVDKITTQYKISKHEAAKNVHECIQYFVTEGIIL